MPAPRGSKFMAEALPLFSRMMLAHMLRPRLAGFIAGGFGDEGIEGASGHEEPCAGMGDEDLHLVVFGDGFETDGLLGGGVEFFDSVHGVLEAVEDSLADLLGVAEDAGQGGRDVHAEVDGALDELGAVELLEVVEEFGDGDGGDLVALGAGDARETLEGKTHVTRLVEDGLDGFVGLGVEVLGFVQKRRVAEDDGEGVVELAGDVAGELAKADELLGFDEFLEHHGLASDRLQAGGEDLEREQINGIDRLSGVFDAGKKDSAFGGCTSAHRDGLYGGELEAGEVVAREPGTG